MAVSIDEVRWTSHLARIRLHESELPAMARELSAVLDYVKQLDSVDCAGVAPLTHPLTVQNVFREDVPEPSLGADLALANAPARDQDFYAVPAVLEP